MRTDYELGIQKERINVTDSIKFVIDVSQKIVGLMKVTLCVATGKIVQYGFAASTHKGWMKLSPCPHQLILQKKPNALLVLVPRHPERFHDVEVALQKFRNECNKKNKR